MEYTARICGKKGCYKMVLSSNLKRTQAHAFYDIASVPNPAVHQIHQRRTGDFQCSGSSIFTPSAQQGSLGGVQRNRGSSKPVNPKSAQPFKDR
jgi:hypothetical protein